MNKNMVSSGEPKILVKNDKANAEWNFIFSAQIVISKKSPDRSTL